MFGYLEYGGLHTLFSISMIELDLIEDNLRSTGRDNRHRSPSMYKLYT